jgi:hypothetical protein
MIDETRREIINGRRGEERAAVSVDGGMRVRMKAGRRGTEAAAARAGRRRGRVGVVKAGVDEAPVTGVRLMESRPIHHGRMWGGHGTLGDRTGGAHNFGCGVRKPGRSMAGRGHDATVGESGRNRGRGCN